MSDHETTDPQEGPDDQAATDDWRRAGDDLRRLGSAFRGHYDAEEGASGDDLKEAARALGRGIERFFGAVGESVRDPEVKATARQAGSSFLDALSATFSQVGEEVGKAFDRSPEGDRPAAEEDDLTAATRELDDADLLDELKSDLAEDEDPNRA